MRFNADPASFNQDESQLFELQLYDQRLGSASTQMHFDQPCFNSQCACYPYTLQPRVRLSHPRAVHQYNYPLQHHHQTPTSFTLRRTTTAKHSLPTPPAAQPLCLAQEHNNSAMYLDSRTFRTNQMPTKQHTDTAKPSPMQSQASIEAGHTTPRRSPRPRVVTWPSISCGFGLK